MTCTIGADDRRYVLGMPAGDVAVVLAALRFAIRDVRTSDAYRRDASGVLVEVLCQIQGQCHHDAVVDVASDDGTQPCAFCEKWV